MSICRNSSYIKLHGFFLITFICVMSFFSTLGSVSSAQAEKRYVQPSAEVVVRRGQGNDYKIVSMVKDGESVELLEESEYYALVRLDNGKEGWMLKRFLSAEPPLEMVVEALQGEKEELMEKLLETEQSLEELAEELTQTESALKKSISERDRVAKDLDDLRRDTADVVGIKNNLEKTQEENAILTQKLAIVEKENGKLKKDRAINWFLAGAGVLFAGVLMGRLPKPTRRRKSSLLT